MDSAFTQENINNFGIPPGNAMILCLDYEKSDLYNNIVGALTMTNATQSNNHSRYLVKKSGTTWSFTLLDSSFAAGVNSSRVRGGTDTFFIGPPTSTQSQGIYKFSYAQNASYIEKTSYDRGSTWQQTYSGPFTNTFSEDGCTARIKYARSRSTDYTIGAVGYNPETTGTYKQYLYFYQSYPGTYNSYEPICSVPSLYGFDFKYDYYNIPTLVTVGSNVGNTSMGLTISRRINGSWVTNNILNNADICWGPYYGVPKSFPFYYRQNSITLSIDFDSQNPNLVYIAYLLRDKYLNAYNDPGQINVCCYNMQTNTVVFNEAVVAKQNQTGAIISTTYSYVDIPILYFNTKNNSLYLMFFATVYNANPATATFQYVKTKRLGTNSWQGLTNFAANVTSNNPVPTSWDIITKY
jgi:hypothetical protein